jgi:hypothetical protein
MEKRYVREGSDRSARPQVSVEAGFEPGDRGEVRPGSAVEDSGDGGVVDAGEFSCGTEAPAVELGTEPEGEETGDLGGVVIAGGVGPVSTEVSGFTPLRSGHDNTVGPAGQALVETDGERSGDVTPPTYLVSSNQRRNGRVVTETPGEIVRRILSYKPTLPAERWAAIEAFTRLLIADAIAATPYSTKDLLTYTSRYVDWATRVACQPLDRELLLNGRLIEQFVIAGDHGWSDGTRANARSILLKVAEALVGVRPDLELTPTQKAKVQLPYTRAEVQAFRVWGGQQFTAERRQNTTVFLALTLGVGAAAGEVSALMTDEIDVAADGVFVNFEQGLLRQRRVRVRDEWADVVVEAKQRVGPELRIFRPYRTNYDDKNAVTNYIAKCSRIRPRPVSQRFRTTWIINLIEDGTSPLTVIEQAGLTDMNRLRRIVSATPTVDHHEFAARYQAELAERRKQGRS